MGIEVEASDGLRVSVDADGSLRAHGKSTEAVFPGQREPAAFAGAYEAKRAEVAEVLGERNGRHDGVRLSEGQLVDLVQRIVIGHFYVYNINYGRLELRPADLEHPQTYREIQRVAGLRVKRGRPGHDELCAALCGLSLEGYRGWAHGNDLFENR